MQHAILKDKNLLQKHLSINRLVKKSEANLTDTAQQFDTRF